MDAVLRAVFIYLFILLMLRVTGKRTLSEMTTVDLIILLLISEASEGALIGGDHSMTNSVLVVLTLFGMSVLLSYLKLWSPKLERVIDGTAIIIVDHGKLLQDRMRAERVGISDILEAAREMHGLERLEQIKYAVLEKNGKISIIPAKTEVS